MTQDESTYGFSKTDATELVQLIGGGDREYTEGKVRSSGGGNTNIKIAYAASGIAARSATFVYAGVCTEYKITGTGTTRTLATNTTTFDVFNIDLKAIPAGTFFIAEKEHITGVWIAKHPAIINLRLSGNNLQYTYDNDTWSTWHTGTTC